MKGLVLPLKVEETMGLSCAQRWSITEKTGSSKVEQTEQVNEYWINKYQSLSIYRPFKGFQKDYVDHLKAVKDTIPFKRM